MKPSHKATHRESPSVPSARAAFLVVALLGFGLPAPLASAEDDKVSREATVGGVRFVLLTVSREVILTGANKPEEACRHRLRITFLVERLERPKKSVDLQLGELQVLLTGTEKRADQGANMVSIKGYPLNKYLYPDRIPPVREKEWASIYELVREPMRKIEAHAIDIRIKGIGLEGKTGNCEFRKIPLD